MMPMKILKGLGLLAIVGGVIWLSGGFGVRVAPGNLQSDSSPPLANMLRAAVERVIATTVECASGTLVSADRTAISSRILAQIKEVRVVAGDLVSAGDIIVRLDSRDLESRVDQARNLLEAARAESELARVEETRAKQLLDSGVGTRQSHDKALTALQVATAQVERMTRGFEEARIALTYGTLRTPVAGRVVDRLAEPGDMAVPGVPLLRIYDPARLRVEAPVRESLAAYLRIGDPIRVHIAALNRQLAGTIDEIVPYVEPGARTRLVKAALPADDRLVAGMFARIGVPAGEKARFYIPAAAIERIGQLEFVAVLGASGRIEKKLVTTGEMDPEGRVEALSGLTEGENVVWHQAGDEKPSSLPQKSAFETACSR
jgi:RND family efflux transporter MFP subunit